MGAEDFEAVIISNSQGLVRVMLGRRASSRLLAVVIPLCSGFLGGTVAKKGRIGSMPEVQANVMRRSRGMTGIREGLVGGQ